MSWGLVIWPSDHVYTIFSHFLVKNKPFLLFILYDITVVSFCLFRPQRTVPWERFSKVSSMFPAATLVSAIPYPRSPWDIELQLNRAWLMPTKTQAGWPGSLSTVTRAALNHWWPWNLESLPLLFWAVSKFVEIKQFLHPSPHKSDGEPGVSLYFASYLFRPIRLLEVGLLAHNWRTENLASCADL